MYMSIGYYDKALKILREEINKELPDKSKLRVKLILIDILQTYIIGMPNVF